MRAVFIDRDGTLGGSDQIEYPGEFTLYKGVEEHIRKLKDSGFLLFSFTNQPGISEGRCSKEQFRKELLGFGMDDVYLCPHKPSDQCECRKPATGMIEEACYDYHLKLNECIVIGDRLKDMEAGKRAGCKRILVRTGGGEEALRELERNQEVVFIHYVAIDINDAIQWLLRSL
ncbi:D,D-heptose 1,7-bisphosphate phosphatase [Halobacillus andaensis]|uniref:D,D-heptose 1,7-bisphosphate phosphatase n=1 Tax=Halobacillus andaensis TaxID=1176239 RepID=A0A917BBX7_HALAA|nr:HAD-IIIA family hydrolase [Halobacillus andaensis]MBP2006402.1 histidinol-phosphate phosphatase family protein [Halobacillus andaensis]GGF34888.1 D,D-heptose 1,7-bisphosphate phosphatase [Halobacillus andaensis]